MCHDDTLGDGQALVEDKKIGRGAGNQLNDACALAEPVCKEIAPTLREKIDGRPVSCHAAMRDTGARL
jgi:hypothetical protein